MPKCPLCGHEWLENRATEGEEAIGVIEGERKIIVREVPEGKAIGCLYCVDCKKFGWGDNKCRWCGGTNVALASERCGVEDYKRGIRT